MAERCTETRTGCASQNLDQRGVGHDDDALLERGGISWEEYSVYVALRRRDFEAARSYLEELTAERTRSDAK